MKTVLALLMMLTFAVPASAGAPSLAASASAAIGTQIEVSWQAGDDPAGPDDFIAIARPGDPAAVSAGHAWLQRNPARLRLPLEPGQWELRYVTQQDGGYQVLARREIVLDDIAVMVTAPQTVRAGERFTVGHDGPGYPADYLAIAPVGSGDDAYISYAYAGNSGTARITAPASAGTYELRYVASGNVERVLGRAALRVKPVAITLDAPAQAPAGSQLMVQWNGPGNDADYIEIGSLGTPPGSGVAYGYTRDGNPLGIRLPQAPGAYELRYIANGDTPEVRARRPLTITPVDATLSAPAVIVQGSRLRIGWTGPANLGDYIALAHPGDPATSAVAYRFIAADREVDLRIFAAPGRYELRYVASPQPARVLARTPLEVRPAVANLVTPPHAIAGATLAIDWSGPGEDGDLIVAAHAGSGPRDWVTFTPVVAGRQARLALPVQPGTYELRYLLGGRTPVDPATRPITLDPPAASVQAQSDVSPGEAVAISWTGPANPGDLIAIARADAPPAEFLAAADALQQSTVTLSAPTEPGNYDLRYLAGGVRTLARQPLQVQAADATLAAPATAVAGALLSVGFTGPANRADFIAVVDPAAPDRTLATAAVRDGNPAQLRLPSRAGDYELRYIVPGRPRDQVLATHPIRVRAAAAAVFAPTRGGAGGTAPVDWSGPANPGDLLVIAAPDAPAEDYLTNYHLRHDSTGHPAPVPLPEAAGTYEVRYLLRGRPIVIAARAPIAVTPATAELHAPATARQGQTIIVRWQGPGNPRDRIELVRTTDAAVLQRLYVLIGNPLTMHLPDTTGSYRLRYMTGQRETTLASHDLQIVADD